MLPRRPVIPYTDLPGADVRHLGLTLGQYGSLALLGVAVMLAMRLPRPWRRAS